MFKVNFKLIFAAPALNSKIQQKVKIEAKSQKLKESREKKAKIEAKKIRDEIRAKKLEKSREKKEKERAEILNFTKFGRTDEFKERYGYRETVPTPLKLKLNNQKLRLYRSALIFERRKLKLLRIKNAEQRKILKEQEELKKSKKEGRRSHRVQIIKERKVKVLKKNIENLQENCKNTFEKTVELKNVCEIKYEKYPSDDEEGSTISPQLDRIKREPSVDLTEIIIKQIKLENNS